MQTLPLSFKQPFETEFPTNINKTFLNAMPYESPEIQKVISNTYIGQTLHEDTLGKLFEKTVDERERKNLGQFYTPKEIVNYILEFLDIKKDSKILDPTCGCGVFLVAAYKRLHSLNKSGFKNIYGVDLNKTAAELTRMNLWLRDGTRTESLEILEKNIRVGNSIVENKNLDYMAFDWSKEFKHILNGGGFDFVIGNPPYITLKKNKDYDSENPLFSQVINGSVNAASLIIVRSWQLLKNGGVMAFVLPKTLLRVNSYLKLRRFILDNFKVLHIVDLENYFSEVRGEQILLFAEKVLTKEKTRGNRVLFKLLHDKTKSISEQQEFYLNQDLFKKFNNFLLFNNKRLYSLVEKIGKIGKPLEQFAEIFRGLTISPSSNLVSCKAEKKFEPIIKGSDISKLDFRSTYFIRSDKLARHPKLTRLKRKKIILQNIFSSESGIISTVDTRGCLTFDTVTNVVIKTDKIKEEYLLGLLNSKLINFYLIYALFNKSKLTMHTDNIYLGKLPVVICENKKRDDFERLVRKFKETKDKAVLKEIDQQVYDIYGIENIEQGIINDALRGIMSPKSFR